MGFEGEVWHVRDAHGGEDVGEIVVAGADFPWLSGRFAPGPGYAAVAALFARELALAEQDRDELLEEWEEVYDEIRRRVSLVSPRGPVPEFLLHVGGGEAWFRWSDEPFDGT
ncbi:MULTISPECIES: hypothetical protein [unclassified Streptomyces]|uniref:hypothetical protein n=1 Tax=unclassified Streptomyces TaxID=2593676 RepID=UPI000708B3DA|nr:MULTISPECIES: hypothetical protein [unclassified Streptomyces]KRD07644.1 hypothetical protein ASE41_31355 [Streptomyces sp. Root264]